MRDCAGRAYLVLSRRYLPSERPRRAAVAASGRALHAAATATLVFYGRLASEDDLDWDAVGAA
jgi:hypothetical protein